MDYKLASRVSELLTIKFEYLKQVSDTDLFLELVPLHRFLVEIPVLYDVILKSWIELLNENKRFLDEEESVRNELRTLKARFIELFPDMNDSDYETHFEEGNVRNALDIDYMFTFKRFDNLLAGIKVGIDNGVPVEKPDRYDNQSIVNKALQILLSKYETALHDHKDKIQEAEFQQFFFDLSNVRDNYRYFYNRLINYSRVSLGAEFQLLNTLVNELNPTPRVLTKLEDLIGSPQPYALRSLTYNFVRDISYKGIQPEPQIVLEVRGRLNRLYNGLLSGISQNLLHSQVVTKYKTRCMWYDKKRVRSILLDDEGNFIRGKEDALIKEMARYLFDNGFPVMFHIQTENLQTDLMDPSVKYSLLIEGKAYKESCKSELLQGIAQLHGYLNNFETEHYYIREAYYVVFRISGPIYDFPEEVITNRYRIVPILIDLGDSLVSGSRQQNQPVIIKTDEIIQEIEVVASEVVPSEPS